MKICSFAKNCHFKLSQNFLHLLSHLGQGGGGGLSSGAIAGIVVGILVVLFIVVPLVYAYGHDLWKKGRVRGWWRRQRSRARAWTIGLRRDATTRENNLAALELELSNDTQEVQLL